MNHQRSGNIVALRPERPWRSPANPPAPKTQLFNGALISRLTHRELMELHSQVCQEMRRRLGGR